MSQENVEVVRASLDAYRRRDTVTLRALNHPDMELDWSASRGFQAGIYRGFDEALRFYDEYFAAFDTIIFEPLSFIDVDDSVVVPNVAHQRGRDGIEVTARSALVFTVRDRRISRICLYQRQEDALKAVGLEE
jgi:ketosteroid isomerase-like protein